MIKEVTLTGYEIQDLRNQIQEFRDMFSHQPGRTDEIIHDIELTSEEPVKGKPYRASQKQKEMTRKEIQSMLELEV